MIEERPGRIAFPQGPYRASDLALNWDATRADAPAELFHVGYDLAYLLTSDRTAAIETLVAALEKVRVSSRRELKRLYWRDKHGERPVRRIARSDLDMLQWLVLFEADKHERAQEKVGCVTPETMIVRYIKQLVQLTTALSSFYVNVGVTRMLHCYTTSEAQRVYELLSSKYLGPDEYRRAKAVLMDKLSQRFSTFLSTVRSEHGELRFATVESPSKWAGLVRACLQAFTPWSTQSRCIQFAAMASTDTERPQSNPGYFDQNETELRSCHVLIEPDCYSRITRELALDLPDNKLAIPRFSMPDERASNDNPNLDPAARQLSQEDINEIRRRLALTSERQRKANQRAIVLVDGTEHTRLDLLRQNDVQIGLEVGASLVEIRTEDEHGDFPAVTHMISYLGNEFEPVHSENSLANGRLAFDLTPMAKRLPESARAILALNYRPKLQFARPAQILQALGRSAYNLWGYALACLVMAVLTWGVASLFYLHQIKSLEQKLQNAQHEHVWSPTAARAIVSYVLARDDERVRGVEDQGVPEISLDLYSPAIGLELPLRGIPVSPSYVAELKTFAEDRTLMTQNFVQAVRTDHGASIEIIVPTDLLRPGSYYTVELGSPGRSDPFSFKVTTTK